VTTPAVTGFSHGVSSTALSIPAGAAGELLIAAIAWSGSAGTPPTWPSGWTLLGSTHAIGAVDAYTGVWYKVTDGSEGSSVYPTQNTGGPPNVVYHMYRIGSYTGVPAVSAWVDGAGTSGATSSDPPNLTSGFGAVETLWLPVLCWGNSARTVTGYPSGYTDTSSDLSASPGIASCRKFNIAASEDPGIFTTSAGGSWQAAVTVAVNGSGTPLVGVQGSMAVGLIG
jgi:hypothetical protein